MDQFWAGFRKSPLEFRQAMGCRSNNKEYHAKSNPNFVRYSQQLIAYDKQSSVREKRTKTVRETMESAEIKVRLKKPTTRHANIELLFELNFSLQLLKKFHNVMEKTGTTSRIILIRRKKHWMPMMSTAIYMTAQHNGPRFTRSNGGVR